ncbi:MAG: DUF2892 domain-containing protein [Sulfurospirillum sp.]|nr:DUF2892 domain-containing protein [Sulfurospirillum sp.]
MNFNKIRSFCRVFRIIIGTTLIVAGIAFYGTLSYALWFFLGIISLIAGLTNFCPLCMITKKCDLPQK